MHKIIMLELNEVPFFILDDFAQKHPRSALARLLQCSQQYETYCEDSGHLSPWITWPSLHRGVRDEKHCIHEFGQDLTEINQAYPPIWQILNTGGIKVGVFGSLHSYPLPLNKKEYSFLLPDTFAPSSECYPQALQSFQEFNLQMARMSARNVSEQIAWKSAVDFLKDSLSLGVSPSTFIDLGRQLAHEKYHAYRKGRRRTYQSVIAFDLFIRQLERTQPDFCSFFTNHVASAMHRYWAASYPEHYTKFEYDQAWINSYKKEIQFAMKKTDLMLNKLMHFIRKHRDYSLWVASSMGQAATEAIPLATQLYLKKPELFMEMLGLGKEQWTQLPTMLPCVNFRINSEVDVFREKMKKVSVAGKRISVLEETHGFFSLVFGHENLLNEIGLVYDGKKYEFHEAGLQNVEIEDLSGSNAYHIPQGSLLIYLGESKQTHHRVQISTLEIAPALLANFNMKPLGYMKRSFLTH